MFDQVFDQAPVGRPVSKGKSCILDDETLDLFVYRYDEDLADGLPIEVSAPRIGVGRFVSVERVIAHYEELANLTQRPGRSEHLRRICAAIKTL